VSTPRFLLDENIDSDLRRALHRQAPDMVVWMVGDPVTPVRGTPDPDILLWCETNRFLLVTNNRASMPVHLSDHLAGGHHVPGIFVLNPDMTMAELVAEFVLIWGASEAEEYLDLMIYLPVRS
jgi:hypothetical protein